MTESARAMPARRGASRSESASPAPTAASTCSHAPCCCARSAIASSGSIAPASVVPAVATIAIARSPRRCERVEGVPERRRVHRAARVDGHRQDRSRAEPEHAGRAADAEVRGLRREDAPARGGGRQALLARGADPGPARRGVAREQQTVEVGGRPARAEDAGRARREADERREPAHDAILDEGRRGRLVEGVHRLVGCADRELGRRRGQQRRDVQVRGAARVGGVDAVREHRRAELAQHVCGVGAVGRAGIDRLDRRAQPRGVGARPRSAACRAGGLDGLRGGRREPRKLAIGARRAREEARARRRVAEPSPPAGRAALAGAARERPAPGRVWCRNVRIAGTF